MIVVANVALRHSPPAELKSRLQKAGKLNACRLF